MKQLLVLLTISLGLSACQGNSMKSSYDEGKLYKKWSFEKIEPYNEQSSDPEFIERINVTPIQLDFSKGKQGEFNAFFPNMGFYDSDYLISHDIYGDVRFDVHDEVIIANFSDQKSEYDFDIRNLRIIHFNGEVMVFEMGDKMGNLYHIFME